MNEKEELQKELQEHFQAIVDATNSKNSEYISNIMINVMKKTHLTLQQNFIRSLISFINKMNDMPRDGRNEAALDWCEKVSTLEKEAYLPYI